MYIKARNSRYGLKTVGVEVDRVVWTMAWRFL